LTASILTYFITGWLENLYSQATLIRKLHPAKLEKNQIIKPLGDLNPGEYRLCKYLTKKLKAFYKDHYLEIKRASQEKNP